MYKDNLAVLTSIQHYKEFVKNIKGNLEIQRKAKKEEEQKELLKKQSQPKILIMNEPVQNNSYRGGQSDNQVKVNMN